MNKILFLISLCLISCGPDDNIAIRALQSNGYQNIRILDSDNVGVRQHCPDKIAYYTNSSYYEAKATNPSGKDVRVVVCCYDADCEIH